MVKRICVVLLVVVATIALHAQEGIQQTLERLRSKYPNGDDTAAVYLNEVAWIHRAEGIVLLGKAGGHACAQPKTGKMVSCDYLVDSNTKRGWDVIRGDAAGTPQYGGDGEDLSGALADGSRSLVPPVDPGTGNEPPPPPPPPPPPSVDLQPLLDRLTVLESEVSVLAGKLRDVWGHFGEVDAKVKALESHKTPTSCVASINLGARIPISCKLQ